MTIDWTNFTPWASLAGGVLLGIASALFILANGRILGISGILGGLLRPKAGDAGWRIAATRCYPPARLVADWPTIEPIWMLEPDVDHLARILREVDADAGERARRAAAAQRAAQAYGWDAIADAVLAKGGPAS